MTPGRNPPHGSNLDSLSRWTTAAGARQGPDRRRGPSRQLGVAAPSAWPWQGIPCSLSPARARTRSSTRSPTGLRGNDGYTVHPRGDSPRALLSTSLQWDRRHSRQPRIGRIAIVPDQKSEDVFVPFFGKLAGTVAGPAVLALKTGAAILPMFCPRQPDGTYRMVIYPGDHDPTPTGDYRRRRATASWPRSRRTLKTSSASTPTSGSGCTTAGACRLRAARKLQRWMPQTSAAAHGQFERPADRQDQQHRRCDPCPAGRAGDQGGAARSDAGLGRPPPLRGCPARQSVD